MTTKEDTIFEEDSVTDEKSQSNFKSRVGNVLRRSKRFMSGRRRESLIEKENAPTNLESDTNGSQSGSIKRDPSTIGNGRKISQTVFSSEQQVLIDGRSIKQVEVTGEKSLEPMDSKKSKKMSRKKSTDNSELNIACRNLGNADFEGWLMKKAGGHGLVPVSWKKYWCVIKSGNIYCYKTSFDIAADYAIPIKNFSIEDADEKKKIAFRMKPHDEVTKHVVFAGDNEAEIKKWVEILNLVISGVDISQTKNNAIPDYEERKRVYSTNQQTKEVKRHGASAFSSADTETTGMPGGFSTRNSSISQPRARLSSSTSKPETCLAVGSMFSSIADIEIDTPTKDVPINEILYKEVVVEVDEAEIKKKADLERLNAEIAKLNSDMLVLNPNGERKSFSLPSKALGFKQEETVVMSVNRAPSPKNFVNEDTVEMIVKDEDKHEISKILSGLEVTEDAHLLLQRNSDKDLTDKIEENELDKFHSDKTKEIYVEEISHKTSENKSVLSEDNEIEENKIEAITSVLMKDFSQLAMGDEKNTLNTNKVEDATEYKDTISFDLHVTETVTSSNLCDASVNSDQFTPEFHDDTVVKINNYTVVTQTKYDYETVGTVVDKESTDLNISSEFPSEIQFKTDSLNTLSTRKSVCSEHEKDISSVHRQSNESVNQLLQDVCVNVVKIVEENDNNNQIAADTQSKAEEFSDSSSEEELKGEESVSDLKVPFEKGSPKTEELFVQQADNFVAKETVTLPITKLFEQDTSDNHTLSFNEVVETRHTVLHDEKDSINTVSYGVDCSYSSVAAEEKLVAGLLSSFEKDERVVSVNFGDDLEIPPFIETSLSDAITIELISNNPNKMDSSCIFESIDTSS